jgi:hypothetical protein
VGDATGYGAQTAFVLPVQGSAGTSYLYLADRWGGSSGGSVNDSRYVWLPLSFPTRTSLAISWAPEITIDPVAGTVAGVTRDYDTLVARHSGKCAGAAGLPPAAGVRIMQDDCAGSDNQKYWLRPVGEGYRQLVSGFGSWCVQENPTDVTHERCDPASAAQQWRLTSGGDHLTLTSRASRRCLDVNGAATGAFASIITYPCTGAINQQWTRGALAHPSGAP